MFRTRWLLGSIGGLSVLVLVALAGPTLASPALIVRNSEGARMKNEVPPLAIPMLRPPTGVAYTPHDAAQVIVRPDRATVAQLSATPAGMGKVETFLPEQGSPDNGKISFAILSTIRYSGNGHFVYVSTVRPSIEAAKQPLGLGNQTVHLADGSTAWADSNLPGDVPNRIVMVRDGLLIAVEGDLPVEALKGMLTSLKFGQ